MVVGLGNPGSRYQDTRHNIGFMVVEALARRHGSFAWQTSSRFSGRFAKGSLAGQRVLLVQPQTYMNLSGQCVQPLAHFYNVPPTRMVAVHDDVDLEPGRLKLKRGGGDGGHKGVRSMAQLLGDPGFFRVRCGVGRPEHGDLVGHVLRRFGAGEARALEAQVKAAADAVVCIMERGLREAMNRHNSHPREGKKKEAGQRED